LEIERGNPSRWQGKEMKEEKLKLKIIFLKGCWYGKI